MALVIVTLDCGQWAPPNSVQNRLECALYQHRTTARQALKCKGTSDSDELGYLIYVNQGNNDMYAACLRADKRGLYSTIAAQSSGTLVEVL